MHRARGKKIPEAVRPHRRRRGGAAATWYKISYIYVSVKDLAELTSEGETAERHPLGWQLGRHHPAAGLQPGQRRGAGAVLAQRPRPQYDSSHPRGDAWTASTAPATASGRCGHYQRRRGLTVDGSGGPESPGTPSTPTTSERPERRQRPAAQRQYPGTPHPGRVTSGHQRPARPVLAAGWPATVYTSLHGPHGGRDQFGSATTAAP